MNDTLTYLKKIFVELLIILVEGFVFSLVWNWAVPTMIPGIVEAGTVASNLTLMGGVSIVLLIRLIKTVGPNVHRDKAPKS